MFQVVVGHSDDPDTASAADELITQCRTDLAGLTPAAGLLLAGIDFDHAALLDALLDAWPDLALIGCTTDGEISSRLEFQQDSATLMLFCCDAEVQIGAGIGEQVSADPAAASRRAVDQARAGIDRPLRLCIAVPESLMVDGIAVLDGLRAALTDDVPVVGGLAADRWQFKTTYQFHGRQVYTDAVPVLLFAGELRCAHGVASGWHPIGRPGVVTRARGNVVYEIDGGSALDYYRAYLGEHEPSSNYPLAVFTDAIHFYLRAPSGEFDPQTGSVSFFADVPQGAQVQMSESSREDILAATRESMQQAVEAWGEGRPAAALYFSCASRRQLLGTRTREEFELVRGCCDIDLPSCGFYTNGEISPMAGGETTRFHNETFISLLIGSDAGSRV